MRLSVTVYGRDSEEKGKIVWDGTDMTATGSPAVRVAARDPIAPQGVSESVIRPDNEPERFMRNLWLVYRSPYFRATKAVES